MVSSIVFQPTVFLAAHGFLLLPDNLYTDPKEFGSLINIPFFKNEYKNNSHCKNGCYYGTINLFRAYCSEQQLAIVCLPLGIGVPGGFLFFSNYSKKIFSYQ